MNENTVTIKELGKLKSKLENELYDSLNDFEKDTSVVVKYISIVRKSDRIGEADVKTAFPTDDSGNEMESIKISLELEP